MLADSYKMNYRQLSPELQAVAANELNEDPEKRDQYIQDIKDWLTGHPYLRARTDDQWILNFLRGCEFSLEETKRKLENYYVLRADMPEITANRDPFEANAQKFLHSGSVVELPERDDAGCRVIVVRNGLLPVGAVPIDDCTKVNFMCGDVTILEDDAAIVCGEVAVQDLHNVTLGHLMTVKPWQMRRVMQCYQEGYPLRPKGIHVINIPRGLGWILTMVQSLMNNKLKKTLFVHTSIESLHQHIPKRILPTEYGGDAGPIDQMENMWRLRIEKNAAFFEEDEQYGVDKAKMLETKK